MHFFHVMCRQELIPNTVTYTTLLHGVSHEMVCRGQMPNLVTYSILLDYLCENGHFVEAMVLLKFIEGSNLDLDIKVYSIAIDGMCKVGQLEVEVALDLFSNLSSKGLLLNVYTYSIMTHGLCKRGLLYEGNTLFMGMDENGCSPNDCNYNTIIRGLLRNNAVLRAIQLLP